MGTAAFVALTLLIIGCSTDRSVVTTHATAISPSRLENIQDDGVAGAPEDEGVDSGTIVTLTEWIRGQRIPIFSFLISRNGRLVYELYTTSLTRNHAHYQMSATKSVASALVGIAIDQGLISGPNAPITETLPRQLFASDADVARFRSVTVRHVLGMSALDAPDPPRVTTPEAVARHLRFRSAHNRVKFALEQPLLATPGRAYQYNDVTPALAVGLVQYATGKTALEFAEDRLFGPMGLRNYEWMHQDPSGIDLGGFGLRPIDMQKFGVLYLNGGVWRGNALISRSWVDRSFSPWNRSRADARDPDYGWFWWTYEGASAEDRRDDDRQYRGWNPEPRLQRPRREVRGAVSSREYATSCRPGDPVAAHGVAGRGAHRSLTDRHRGRGPNDSFRFAEGPARAFQKPTVIERVGRRTNACSRRRANTPRLIRRARLLDMPSCRLPVPTVTLFQRGRIA